MDKPITLKGLDNLKIPKCNVLVDNIHDENGKPFNKFKIRIIPGEYINYMNDTKIGLIPETNPDKDLIVALMELGDDPKIDDIVHFFESYGFFLSHTNITDDKYRDYSEQTIKKFIRYIQKIIILMNSYKIYSQPDMQNRKSLDYTQLCNLLIDVIFTKSFLLYDKNDDLFIMNDNILLGFNYRDDFINTCHSCGLPRPEPVFDDSGIKAYDITCHPFDDFIRYRNEGRISIFYDDHNFDNNPSPTWKTPEQKLIYTFLYHLLNSNRFKYTEEIAFIDEDEETRDYLIKNNKVYEIPYIENLNGLEEPIISLQNELISVIPFIILEQIRSIIKNIYPNPTIINNELSVSFGFKNLTNVIFWELLNFEQEKYECRKCCKEDCPLVGRYYFIVDSKNKSKKCYSTACRNRINKQLFDQRHTK